MKHNMAHSLSLRVYLKGLGCIWVVEHLPSMHRVLGPNPSTIAKI